MTASASPSPVYLDGRRIVVAAGREPRSPRDALIDVVRKYVVGRGDDDAVERFIDHVDRLPADQRRELLRLGVLAAIEAGTKQPPAEDPADRPHAPAVRSPKDKASWTPPASTGSGVAARLAVVATYSTTATYEAQLVQMLRGIGVELVGTCTTTPQTSSTDNWATTVNQTKLDGGARDTYIQTRNAAVRAGTHPAGYDFLIDWGATVESTIGSGLWKPNVPGDSTHPKEAWHSTDAWPIARAAIQAAMATLVG